MQPVLIGSKRFLKAPNTNVSHNGSKDTFQHFLLSILAQKRISILLEHLIQINLLPVTLLKE